MHKHSGLRADLHVHSKHSTRPSQWVLRKLGAAESYTEPKRLYALALDRGMDLVTITDHNSVAGCLEIAHMKNTFLSEEVTTYFPHDRCKLHVLVYGITERQHEDIQHLRENVHDLVQYLRSAQIVHVLAHPMYPVNDRLTLEHFEQTLLLFKTFEWNGMRSPEQNRALFRIVRRLTRERLERLADKYGIEPPEPGFWKKHVVSGSDDHSSLLVASAYTEVPGAGTPEDFLRGLAEGRCRPHTRASTPIQMAHAIYSIAYQFYSKRFPHLLEPRGPRDLLKTFARQNLLPSTLAERRAAGNSRSRVLTGDKKESPPEIQKAFDEMLLLEADRILGRARRTSEWACGAPADPRKMAPLWFRFVEKVSDRVARQSCDVLLEGLAHARLFQTFHTIGAVGSLYTLLVPYFVSYGLFSKDRRLCESYVARIENPPDAFVRPVVSMAHFTDTLDDINGVAKTLRMQAAVAAKNGKTLRLITCGSRCRGPGIKNFPPVGSFEVPEYPGMRLFYPPLLRILDYCYRQKFTRIHAATPGPMGVAALAVARILGVPIFGTYHTALPQYGAELTQDPSVEKMIWKFVVWFYNQMDAVYVPSRAVQGELIQRGVKADKLRLYARGIDLERFHPAKANGFFQSRFGLPANTRKLLYVGRVSQEKNLPFLVDVFIRIARERANVHLVVVGDGPYLGEMKRALSAYPACFTGFLEGNDLAEVYASSDIFVFPSTTDTFGNVVLEAQASGLPVIVTDAGGPQENVAHGKTGYVVPASDREAFVQAVLRLLDRPKTLAAMKRNARSHVADRAFESAYLSLWESYADQGYDRV